MSLIATNWALTSYTNSTWTDLVSGSGAKVIKTLCIITGSNIATIKVRVVNSSGTLLYTVHPGATLNGNDSNRLDWGSGICLNTTEKLQVQASASGVEFSAHGAA